MPRTSLPRARGDRPDGVYGIEQRQQSPPRTRGSTPDAAGYERDGWVSPAHAGIDLSVRSRY